MWALDQLQHFAWPKLANLLTSLLHAGAERHTLPAPQEGLLRALKVDSTSRGRRAHSHPARCTVAQDSAPDPLQAEATVVLGLAKGLHDLAYIELPDLLGCLNLEAVREGDVPCNPQHVREGRDEGSAHEPVGREALEGNLHLLRRHCKLTAVPREETTELLLSDLPATVRELSEKTLSIVATVLAPCSGAQGVQNLVSGRCGRALEVRGDAIGSGTALALQRAEAELQSRELDLRGRLWACALVQRRAGLGKDLIGGTCLLIQGLETDE
mmetsp:Transcript_98785/g.221316  ORF Transcript_98785/g.221316 Transcript_98785/m.221316 type:complete len:270 (-) Transcript_98785:9-818(-)